MNPPTTTPPSSSSTAAASASAGAPVPTAVVPVSVPTAEEMERQMDRWDHDTTMSDMEWLTLLAMGSVSADMESRVHQRLRASIASKRLTAERVGVLMETFAPQLSSEHKVLLNLVLVLFNSHWDTDIPAHHVALLNDEAILSRFPPPAHAVAELNGPNMTIGVKLLATGLAYVPSNLLAPWVTKAIHLVAAGEGNTLYQAHGALLALLSIARGNETVGRLATFSHQLSSVLARLPTPGMPLSHVGAFLEVTAQVGFCGAATLAVLTNPLVIQLKDLTVQLSRGAREHKAVSVLASLALAEQLANSSAPWIAGGTAHEKLEARRIAEQELTEAFATAMGEPALLAVLFERLASVFALDWMSVDVAATLFATKDILLKQVQPSMDIAPAPVYALLDGPDGEVSAQISTVQLDRPITFVSNVSMALPSLFACFLAMAQQQPGVSPMMQFVLDLATRPIVFSCQSAPFALAFVRLAITLLVQVDASPLDLLQAAKRIQALEHFVHTHVAQGPALLDVVQQEWPFPAAFLPVMYTVDLTNHDMLNSMLSALHAFTHPIQTAAAAPCVGPLTLAALAAANLPVHVAAGLASCCLRVLLYMHQKARSGFKTPADHHLAQGIVRKAAACLLRLVSTGIPSSTVAICAEMLDEFCAFEGLMELVSCDDIQLGAKHGRAVLALIQFLNRFLFAWPAPACVALYSVVQEVIATGLWTKKQLRNFVALMRQIASEFVSLPTQGNLPNQEGEADSFFLDAMSWYPEAME